MSNNTYLHESLLGPEEAKKDEKTENEGSELTNQGIVTITGWLFAVRAPISHSCHRSPVHAHALVRHATDPLSNPDPTITAPLGFCDCGDYRCGGKQ